MQGAYIGLLPFGNAGPVQLGPILIQHIIAIDTNQ